MVVLKKATFASSLTYTLAHVEVASMEIMVLTQ